MRKYIYMQHIILVFWILITTACAQNTPKEKNKMEFTTNKTEKEWKETLSEEQYYILREKGTEAPYTGKLLMVKEKGSYQCSACGNTLFTSDSKFDSHCGWPSFDKEIKEGTITTQADSSLGTVRTEIMCGNCGGHLGHVFNDGPTETGLRYCVNSISLEFTPEKKEESHTDTITLGAGCFWCVEAIFQRLKGVISVHSGYAGGENANPSYKEVCSGTTGHAEVVQLVFDTKTISLEEILQVFFAVHDPTTLNRQGNDVGTQYRSAILYRNNTQKKIAQQIIDNYIQEKVFDKPIVTTLEPFSTFYKAEDYHQNYFNENGSQPYCRAIVMPKVRKFEELYKEQLK